MKRLILVIFCMHSLNVFAQGNFEKGDNPPFRERLYFSISPQLSINNFFTEIGVSPSVGVMITPRFSSGVGFTYVYQKPRDFDAQSYYGGRLFSRFNFTERIFAYSEYQVLSFPTVIEGLRISQNYFYVGAGLFERISGRTGFQVLALYNLSVPAGGSMSPWVFRAGITYSPF